MTYQLINVIDATQNIACPYCHQAVLDWEQEQYVQPCEHTLFMAMDLGFEFVSDRFEQKMSRSVDEIHDDETANVYAEIMKVDFEQAILVRSELGVENMYRYTGFAV